MKKRINIKKDPYFEDVDLFKKEVITLDPGITVLIGSNGTGKSTLIRQIQKEIRERNELIISFDNLKEGGQNSLGKNLSKGDMDFVARFVQYSEGECIMLNINRMANSIGKLVGSGKINEEKELWILFDAIDSGLSIDHIVELKTHLFDVILNDERLKDKDIYIIISANSYEIARGERCYDVSKCEYIDIHSYEEYREVILESSKYKLERYEKITKLQEEKNKRESFNFDRKHGGK